jgi:hypothetical protein
VRPVLLLAALGFVHSLIYAILTPPWQAPDEIAHFEYAYLLAQRGRPLTFADASPDLEQQIIHSLYRYRAWDFIQRPAPTEAPERLAEAPFFGNSRTLERFSLAYVPYALAVWPFAAQSIAVQLHVMRLVSALMGAAVVALAFVTARRVEPGSPCLAYGAALFVVFLPQHAYISGTVNDGNLATLLASAALYLAVTMRLDGVTLRRALLAALASAGAILSKATAYFLVPLGIILALDLAWRWYRVNLAAGESGYNSRAAILTGVILATVLALALPLVFLQTVSGQPAHMLLSILDTGLAPGGFAAYIVELAAEGRLAQAIVRSFMSFWAAFGWMALFLPDLWYGLLALACGVSVLGWLWRWRRWPPARGYAVLALAVGLSVAVLWGWFLLSRLGIYGFQGRYYFGALVPVAILLVRGWLHWSPAHRHQTSVILTAAGLVMLNVAVLLVVFVPYFRG